MKIIKIKAYEFNELSEQAQVAAINWLDEEPLEFKTYQYSDEEGNIKYTYFSEMEKTDIAEHCKSNGYFFDKYGNSIHHLETN